MAGKSIIPMKVLSMRSKRFLRFFKCLFELLAILILVSCVDKSGKNINIPGEKHISFSEDGAWCWFSDPRAVYFEGRHKRTYAAWMDIRGNVIIGFYDHNEKITKSEIIHENFEVDDHDNPSIFIDNEGFLFVFYSKHSKREPIYLLKSFEPEEISSWEPVHQLALNDTIQYTRYSNTYTYTNIQQLANEENRLYLFWRGADFKPNFSTSDDNGKSWTTGKIMVLPERIYRDRRPYMKISSNHRNTIHFAFTDGHPGNEPANSIYYAKYKDGTLYKANGDEIMKWQDLPLNPTEADIVYDATLTNEKAWIWDVAEDKSQNPVMVYVRFPNDTIHEYYYAIWNNNQWKNYKLIDSGTWFPENTDRPQREPNYSGGIVLDHENPFIVYLSRQKEGIFEIERWETPDKGKTWKILEITNHSKQNNVRPFVIRNYNEQDSLRILWMNIRKYTHYTDYDASIKMNLKK